MDTQLLIQVIVIIKAETVFAASSIFMFIFLWTDLKYQHLF